MDDKKIADLNIRLVNACGGSISLAASWYAKATMAWASGTTRRDFVKRCKDGNRGIASAAYRLASLEVAK